MVRDIDTAKEFLDLSTEEEKLLLSPQAPIVVCNKNNSVSHTKLQSNVGEVAFAARSEGVERPTSSKGSKNNEAYVLNATWQ
jgi:hypothetical protein